ncbi:hypothetical protein ER308_05475 [Egibacter rhizosphaerae]|uniref:DUF4157 domain-containing protein n=1 Tax=Egibacter rhizosphaerae TaxID=1670831 RepID=A0A411YD35_9ACTN|nr:hypothetical protein [Egibacter rhizosphaerae]QBI19047.1 hypothetical protein ER308_05475 [Egibacter rhizosphaerae]
MTRSSPATRRVVPLVLAGGLLTLSACTALAQDEMDVDVRLDEIAEDVAELRDLELDEPLEGEVLDDDAFVEVMREITEEREGTSQAGAASEDVLISLRHLAPDEPLREDEEEWIDVVGGVYAPERETFYVRDPEGEFTGLEEVTAAHEIQHALQDRAVGLDRLIEFQQGLDTEAFLGLNAVVEGDAVAVQEAWSQEHQDPDDRAEYLRGGQELSDEEQQALEALPGYVADQLQFTYVEGAEFVDALREEGGWEAVDGALADPPATSAEIFHPDRYLGGFEPSDVTVAGEPGDGWDEQLRLPFGAFDQFVLLGHADRFRAAGTTSAWRGGELVSWTDGDQQALGIRVAVDEEDEAAEDVCELMSEWYVAAADGGPVDRPERDGRLLEAGDGRGDVLAVACDGDDVRAGLGPDPDTATGIAEP